MLGKYILNNNINILIQKCLYNKDNNIKIIITHRNMYMTF